MRWAVENRMPGAVSEPGRHVARLGSPRVDREL